MCSIARRSQQPPRIQLWEIADGVLVVTETDATDASQPLGPDATISASQSEIAQMIAASPDLLQRVTRSSLSVRRPALETMASWAELGSGQCSAETKRILAGSTLLLMKTNFCDAAGWTEMEGLRRLGVARLMMRHPYRDDGSVMSISMNTAGRWRERIDLLMLARAAICREMLRRAWPERGLMWLAGPSSEVPADEKEMSDRFALFEGSRQLPPLPVSHATIRHSGGGRYSVWGNHVFFSSTRGGRPKSIWMVPRNPSTQRRLRFISEVIAPSIQKHRPPFLEELKTKIATDGAAHHPRSTLKPGDKVVVLTHALPPGGAERQWCYLAGELKRMGFEVHFVTLFPLEGQSRHYLPLLAGEGIEVTELDQKFDQQGLLQALRSTLERIGSGKFAAGMENPFGPRLRELADLFARLKPQASVRAARLLEPPCRCGRIIGVGTADRSVVSQLQPHSLFISCQ